MATGVDRVELAYLARFLADDTPCFGLARTAFGYLLLDRAGLGAVQDRLLGRAAWGQPDALSRYIRGRTAIGKSAEADFRKFAMARSVPWRLSSMLKNLPGNCQYFNVGHSNLTTRVLSSLNRAGAEIHVLIHDVIPLEYPQYQRRGTVKPFRDKLKRVQKWADRIIYNSADTQQRTERLLAISGRVPSGIVAHLGTIMPRADPAELPDGLPPKQPYFVTVGTIEPRKNHAFLLDLWEKMGPDAPQLLICGGRGWNNEAVFARLDGMGPNGPVREVSNLSDAALSALVQNASGALFPSLAEGFGLPPLEALLLETRVLCNDLGVLREFLGQMPVYASVSEEYQWLRVIAEWAKSSELGKIQAGFKGPTWDDHFKKVLSLRA